MSSGFKKIRVMTTCFQNLPNMEIPNPKNSVAVIVDEPFPTGPKLLCNYAWCPYLSLNVIYFSIIIRIGKPFKFGTGYVSWSTAVLREAWATLPENSSRPLPATLAQSPNLAHASLETAVHRTAAIKIPLTWGIIQPHYSALLSNFYLIFWQPEDPLLANFRNSWCTNLDMWRNYGPAPEFE